MNGENYRFRKSPYFKIIVSLIVISLFVVLGFGRYFSNIKGRGEISRARQELYKVTDSDRTSIIFEYSSKKKFTKSNEIMERYYVFDAVNADGKKYDVRYLVNKKNFSVHIYDKYGFIIPYEDYVDKKTSLGNYFYSLKKIPYNEIPAATKNYLERKGGLAFLRKVSTIMEDINLEAASKCGGIVNYVDYIINGVSQKKLNKEDFWSNG